MNSNAKGINEAPNVYTRETVLGEYSTKSLGITTLGLVGETLIGPAFQPIPISSYKEFLTYFGGTNPEKYPNGAPRYELSYIAKSYLQQSQQLYVTRVLGLSGYKYDGLWALSINNKMFATIRSKGFYDNNDVFVPYITGSTGVTISTPTENITGIDSSFTISTEGENYLVSLNPTNKNYILKVLGTSPKDENTSKIFIEEMYESTLLSEVPNLADNLFNTGSTLAITTKIVAHDDYRAKFRYAKTPWFVSEVKGNKIIPLFRLLTLSDGNNANSMFKVSIANIDLNTLRFDLYIRQINDTDTNPIILEQYSKCSLNPNDGSDYLGAKIGTVDDVYILKSKYVVVEINDNSLVKDSVPMGFEGYECKDISGLDLPLISYNKSYEDTGSLINKKAYFGVNSDVDLDIFSFKGLSGLTRTSGFHLEPEITGVSYLNSDFITLNDGVYNNYVVNDKALMKFTSYFNGGFDGWDIFRGERTNTDAYQFNRYKNNYETAIGQTFNIVGSGEFETVYGLSDVPTTSGLTSDFYAFWSAIRSLSDPEAVDINVLATPGIDIVNNTILINETIDMVQNERKDCIYLVTTPDKPNNAGDSKAEMYNSDTVVSLLNSTGIDSSYAFTYYPWAQYLDKENGVYLYMPVNVDVLKNIAYTDNSTYAWFPPAGLDRGVTTCTKTRKSLLVKDENTLYSNRINYVKTFASDGIKIWGQKTLQKENNPLNRIGTRRMMLYLRKLVRRSNLPLIFEPNDNTTKSTFIEIVSPILQYVKDNRGIADYKIQIDDSPEAKERHEMNVTIWIRPVGSLEYINIDFMITPEGFDFNQL